MEASHAPSELSRWNGRRGSAGLGGLLTAAGHLLGSAQTPHLGGGAWALPGAGGSVESEGEAVSAECVRGAAAAEGPSRSPVFPMLRCGRSCILGTHGAERSTACPRGAGRGGSVAGRWATGCCQPPVPSPRRGPGWQGAGWWGHPVLSWAGLLTGDHRIVRGEAAAHELPPVVNLPPANPFCTVSAVQKGTVSIFCQLQLT